jgi:hypothetical protein
VILESIVTSVNRAGELNVAPMGPRVDQMPSSEAPQDAIFTLRPFESSRTFKNLIETRKAVIHVTDDVELFAKAAVDAIDPELAIQWVRPIEGTPWRVLRDCHRWFAVSIESIHGEGPRRDMRCRVEQSAVVRPFFGFNRAKHAVIEAAILATRTHLLPIESIDGELSRLQPLIDKTAGPSEQKAFEFLRRTIHERIADLH